MNIQQGKQYNLRDGSVVVVLSITGMKREFPVVVEVRKASPRTAQAGEVGFRTAEGRVWTDGKEHSRDIVSEYREPRVIYANIYTTGHIIGHSDKAAAGRKAGPGVVEVGVKFVEAFDD